MGSFSPAGDSPIGAADMGGNVAEWTMSTGDGGVTRVVKGGSYRQSADAARVESEYEIASHWDRRLDRLPVRAKQQASE